MSAALIALAGNPNAGKSTLFNALTGGQQHVGNWPGKTIEKKSGRLHLHGFDLELVDLPGAYSLSSFSPEETVTRDFLVEARPDLVLIVLDAANAERNLYLAAQVLEMGFPAVVALSMTDVAARRCIHIDRLALSAALHAPVVVIDAPRRGEISRLTDAICKRLGTACEADGVAGQGAASFAIDYGPAVEPLIERLVAEIERRPLLAGLAPSPRWLAIRLLEHDEALRARLASSTESIELLALGGSLLRQLEAEYGDDADVLLADRRYHWVHAVAQAAVTAAAGGDATFADRVDAVVTHRWLGLPIFFAAMWFVFKLAIDLTAPAVDAIDALIGGPLAGGVSALLGRLGLGGTPVEGLLIDGVLAGVGGILAFVPVLMSLYLALALLEESGYMARAAFLMDRVMGIVGLHGRSFLPLIVGFGCTVPAVYATRTLEHPRDRILTGLLIPFMSCSARLPVYVLMASVFFPAHAGAVTFALYLLGILAALLFGLILKRLVLPSAEESTFLMELPPYHLPDLRSIWLQTWRRTRAFLRKAWTVILAVSIVVWALMAVPLRPDAPSSIENSLFAGAAAAVSPLFAPLGFGDWQTSGALLTGLVAKEVIASTLAQTYGLASGAEQGESMFPAAVRNGFDAASGGHASLAGAAFLVFVLLYTPCVAAATAAHQEFGARWMWVSVLGQFGVAWAAALLVFQGGRLLGF